MRGRLGAQLGAKRKGNPHEDKTRMDPGKGDSKMNAHSVTQGSPEWMALRRGVPTCSRFDQILTAVTGKPSASQSKLIDELIAESLCPIEEEISRYVSPQMEQGMKLEAEAKCAFEFEYAQGAPVSDVGFIMSDCARFGGSPDLLVGADGGAEIKCPQPAAHIGYLRAGVLPSDYKLQIHGYMIVTGRKWWSFFSYARHLPRFHLRIERDDFTEKLARELAAFAEKYNEARKAFDLPPLGNPISK